MGSIASIPTVGIMQLIIQLLQTVSHRAFFKLAHSLL
jgi:hypothetical protein